MCLAAHGIHSGGHAVATQDGIFSSNLHGTPFGVDGIGFALLFMLYPLGSACGGSQSCGIMAT